MTEWKSVQVGEVAHLINGDRGKNYPSAKHRTASGIPFINAGHLDGGRVRLDSMDFIPPERYQILRSGKVEVDDVLLCIRGSIGRWALVTPDAVPGAVASSLVILRSKPVILPQFLAYHIASPEGSRSIMASNNGAAQPNVGAQQVASLPMLLPPLEDQRRIVDVLGSIDDLIENNRRRVGLLEEMTRAIYREWFVNFRYPGHGDVPLVDSALGPIPEGWEASSCGGELNFIGGGTPSKAEPLYWDGGTVAWYTPTDLTKSRWRYAAAPVLRITEQGVAKSSVRRFPAGSVMMTSRATLGVLAVATTEATTNQGFIVVLPDDRWNSGFIYEWLDSKADDLAALGTGATFKEITKGSFKSFPFIVPAQSALDAYRSATEPLEAQIRVLEQQTRNLSDLRDVLLPKLVTGQIDVSTLNLDSLLAEQDA